ncbi:hypothetical protein NMY22_g7466 [Coprinellus aureogranulatus]|nr:hypothetical protein NMY22_g7466 [Coprinellus aureogranulatus]
MPVAPLLSPFPLNELLASHLAPIDILRVWAIFLNKPVALILRVSSEHQSTLANPLVGSRFVLEMVLNSKARGDSYVPGTSRWMGEHGFGDVASFGHALRGFQGRSARVLVLPAYMTSKPLPFVELRELGLITIRL